MIPIFAAWAILATVLSIGVFVAVTIELKAGTKAIEESGKLRDEAVAALASYKATEKARLSAHMREIGLKGNTSPKRKRVA